MKHFIISLFIILIGCTSTAKNMNSVAVGMTKHEVMQILGEPLDTRATEGIEYMIYELRNAPSAGAQTGCGVAGVYTLGLAYLFDGCQYSDNDYFVQLKQGKVTSYGRVGDFDSTKNPESTININQNIKQVD